MPAMSNVRTPMRLQATPIRTSFLGSFCSSKNGCSALTSASASRTSPSTTMPGSSGRAGELDELVPAVRLLDDRGGKL